MAKKLPGLEALVDGVVTVVQSAATAYLALTQVRPDRQQPRHILPDELTAHYWTSLDVAAILDEFQALAQTDETARDAYDSLTQLADSLESDGLINPITVVPDGAGGYVVRSGERRWWAHQILSRTGRRPLGGKPGCIEVIIRRPEDTQRIVHQLAENIHRENLSAVELAIGLAEMIALIENIDIGLDSPLLPLERLAALRAVAERIRTDGTWDEVTRRLGKTRAHWAHYLAILRLPDDAIQQAYELRLPENALREAAFAPDETTKSALVSQVAEQRGQKRSAAPAARSKQNQQAVHLAAQKKFTSSLRSFSQAWTTLANDGVKPQSIIKELRSDEEQFALLVITAKRLLPVLQAIAGSAQPAAHPAAKAKAKTKSGPKATARPR